MQGHTWLYQDRPHGRDCSGATRGAHDFVFPLNPKHGDHVAFLQFESKLKASRSPQLSARVAKMDPKPKTTHPYINPVSVSLSILFSI